MKKLLVFLFVTLIFILTSCRPSEPVDAVDEVVVEDTIVVNDTLTEPVAVEVE